MQQPEIYHALTEVFHEIFNDDSIVLGPGVIPSEMPGWDSARYVTLIVATECRFRIRFQSAELESLRTVKDFVERIENKLPS